MNNEAFRDMLVYIESFDRATVGGREDCQRLSTELVEGVPERFADLEDRDVEELVEQARAGDFAAFEQLVEMYHDRIYRLAMGMMRQPAEAEEVEVETEGRERKI